MDKKKISQKIKEEKTRKKKFLGSIKINNLKLRFAPKIAFELDRA